MKIKWTEKILGVIERTAVNFEAIFKEKGWYWSVDDVTPTKDEIIADIKEKIELCIEFLENHLDENTFIRIHRSYIINADYILHLEQKGKESYRLILKNNKELPVSKTGLAKLKNTL